MGINIGYLTASRTSAGDEVYTPFYAVEPLKEFLPKDKKIWCPFDEEWSAFYQYGIVKKCAVGEYPKSWIVRYQAA